MPKLHWEDFTAGQVAWDDTGRVVGIGDVAAQTRQVLSNIVSILREAGATPDDVLKCNVYLADMRYFQAMNAVFAIPLKIPLQFL